MKILYKEFINKSINSYTVQAVELQHIWYNETKINNDELNAMYCVELRNFLIYEYDNYTWFKENIHHGFTKKDTLNNGLLSQYYFDDENDALLFKMRFK